jgi:hypothetical protein
MRKCDDHSSNRAAMLSILMVEDSMVDAELNALALDDAGYELQWQRVEQLLVATWVSRIVRTHHERCDGDGYSDGRRGEAFRCDV